jgi:hypothetical protein
MKGGGVPVGGGQTADMRGGGWKSSLVRSIRSGSGRESKRRERKRPSMEIIRGSKKFSKFGVGHDPPDPPGASADGVIES